jgi:hypothetical protein
MYNTTGDPLHVLPDPAKERVLSLTDERFARRDLPSLRDTDISLQLQGCRIYLATLLPEPLTVLGKTFNCLLSCKDIGKRTDEAAPFLILQAKPIHVTIEAPPS